MPSSRPHIALVGSRLGSEFEAAIRLGARRFRYTVLTCDLDPELRPLVDWRPMPRAPFDSFRLGWAIFYALGALRLARLRPDLVHTVGPVPVVPNRVDANTVTFCHAAFDHATAGSRLKGTGGFGWQLGQRVMLELERWWFRRRVRTLVAISDGSAEDLRRWYPGVDVAVLSRGIDLARFRPDAADRGRFRDELGVPADAVVALFVDQQFRPYKGLDLALRGFARARAAGGGPDHLWVVGYGNDARATLASELGLSDRVSFFGHRSDVERFCRAADFFVLPTAYEAFCRAAHEAAASGLAVVAPPVSGIRELVGNDEAGVIVRRDPDDLARAMTLLAGDPQLRVRMGAIGRGRVRGCDLAVTAQHIVTLHASLLAGRDASSTIARGR